MNAPYSIPETAKLTGIPEHAIREYAKQFADVLPHPEIKSESGRAAVKRYPDAALSIFQSIRKLKDDGLDTAAIRSALAYEKPTAATQEWTEASDEVTIETAAEETWSTEYEATETAEAAVEESTEYLATETTGETETYTEIVAEPAEAITEEATAGEEQTAEVIATGEEGIVAESEFSTEQVLALAGDEAIAATEAIVAAEDTIGVTVTAETATDEPIQEAAAEETVTIEEGLDAQETVETFEAAAEQEPAVRATFYPLFTNLDDGLRQLRKIMDENLDERDDLRLERGNLLTETANQQAEIEQLKATIATQEERIGGLQTALSALMNQCDQQVQAIRSALGQA